jgi:hypothetical protein
MSRRLAVVRSFFDDFLQNAPIQRQIGHQTLQPGVLVSQLPQLEQPEIAVALLPDVAGRLADPHLPAHICDRLPRIPQLQIKQHLLLGEPGLLHRFRSLSFKERKHQTPFLNGYEKPG